MSQDSLFVFNTQAASNDFEPINYLTESSDHLVQNNIFRYAEKAVVATGRSFAPGGSTRLEVSGFGGSRNGIFRNNLFYSISGDKWGGSSGDAWHGSSNSEEYTFDHNTVIDMGLVTRHGGSSRRLVYTNNIFIPWLGGAIVPGTWGDSASDWTSLVAVRRVVDSVLNKNIHMNRNSVTTRTIRGPNYPEDTYLIQSNDPGRDPAALFMNWVEGDYAGSNYRVKPEAAASFPTTDGRAIGADIDEIEALTGRDGVAVVAGVPPYAERSLREIDSSGTRVTLKYLPSTPAQCKVQVWNTLTYSGPPEIDIDDSGAVIENDWRILQLPQLTAGKTYYGKRWCDVEVDTFQFSIAETAPDAAALSAALNQIQAPPLSGASHAQIEYGLSRTLGFYTQAVACDSRCMLSIPPAAVCYRIIYRNSVGAVIARGDIVVTEPGAVQPAKQKRDRSR
jgi:hypothetical protein